MYLNELTGSAARGTGAPVPVRTELRAQTGATIDSAMISDVPATPGARCRPWPVRYKVLLGRAQTTLTASATSWSSGEQAVLVDRSGRKSKVLVWIPFWGYAMSHRYGTMSPQLVEDFCAGLEQRGYPTISPTCAGPAMATRRAGSGDLQLREGWNASTPGAVRDRFGERSLQASRNATATSSVARGLDTLLGNGAGRPRWNGVEPGQLRPARADGDALAMQGAARYPPPISATPGTMCSLSSTPGARVQRR